MVAKVERYGEEVQKIVRSPRATTESSADEQTRDSPSRNHKQNNQAFSGPVLSISVLHDTILTPYHRPKYSHDPGIVEVP